MKSVDSAHAVKLCVSTAAWPTSVRSFATLPIPINSTATPTTSTPSDGKKVKEEAGKKASKTKKTSNISIPILDVKKDTNVIVPSTGANHILPKLADSITAGYIEGLDYRTLQKVGRSLRLNAKLPRKELIDQIHQYCQYPEAFATPITLESLNLFDLRFIAKHFGIPPTTKKHEIIRILNEEQKRQLSEQEIVQILSSIKRKGKRVDKSLLVQLVAEEFKEEKNMELKEDELPIVKAFELIIQSIEQSNNSNKPSKKSNKQAIAAASAALTPSPYPKINYTSEEADHFLAFLHDQKLSDYDDLTELNEELLLIYRAILEDASRLYQKESYPPILSLTRPRMKNLMFPLNVVGDIGGHFDNLMYILSEAIGGFPSAKNSYVFLGNIISSPVHADSKTPTYWNENKLTNHKFNLEQESEVDHLNAMRCFFALLFVKMTSPSSVHILRCNESLLYLQQQVKKVHESDASEDVKELYAKLLEVYQKFPVGAVVEKSTFLCPGGVGPLTSTMTINDMNQNALSTSGDLTCWMKELIFAGKFLLSFSRSYYEQQH